MKGKINKALLTSIKPKAGGHFDVWDEDLPGFLLRCQPTGHMAYYVAYRRPNDNKRAYHLIGTAKKITPAQARDVAKKALADVTKRANPAAAKHEAREGVTLQDFLDTIYGPDVEATKKSGKATVARLKQCFAAFLNRRLDDISQTAIEAWRGKRLKESWKPGKAEGKPAKEGRKPSTLNRDLSALKAALNKAVHLGFITQSPLVKLKLQKLDRSAKVRYLSSGEEKRLLDALDAREEGLRRRRESHRATLTDRKVTQEEIDWAWPDLRKLPFADYLKPMIVLSLNLGFRRGELFSLEWEDVSLDTLHPTITVQGIRAKGGVTRHLPLNDVALSTLKDWQRQTGKTTGLIFAGKTGERFNNVSSAWETLLEDAKIKEFRWHDMRHHFASRLVQAGVDLYRVQRLLGHSSIRMTERYSHLNQQNLQSAVNLLLMPRPTDNVVPMTKKQKTE